MDTPRVCFNNYKKKILDLDYAYILDIPTWDEVFVALFKENTSESRRTFVELEHLSQQLGCRGIGHKLSELALRAVIRRSCRT